MLNRDRQAREGKDGTRHAEPITMLSSLQQPSSVNSWYDALRLRRQAPRIDFLTDDRHGTPIFAEGSLQVRLMLGTARRTEIGRQKISVSTRSSKLVDSYTKGSFLSVSVNTRSLLSNPWLISPSPVYSHSFGLASLLLSITRPSSKWCDALSCIGQRIENGRRRIRTL